MSASGRPTRFGRIHHPDEAWLAGQPAEAILEPELPIIDTHHHLWNREGHRYLLTDFLADAATGHNLVATVFLECHAMYRAAGPVGLWNALKRIAGGASAAEKQAMFSGTARRVYRLDA